MLEAGQGEYRKMLELSAKMNVVGHACTEIAGRVYDTRRQTIGKRRAAMSAPLDGPNGAIRRTARAG